MYYYSVYLYMYYYYVIVRNAPADCRRVSRRGLPANRDVQNNICIYIYILISIWNMNIHIHIQIPISGHVNSVRILVNRYRYVCMLDVLFMFVCICICICTCIYFSAHWYIYYYSVHLYMYYYHIYRYAVSMLWCIRSIRTIHICGCRCKCRCTEECSAAGEGWTARGLKTWPLLRSRRVHVEGFERFVPENNPRF